MADKKIKPQKQWEHFMGNDPTSLQKRSGRYFDGDREVVVVTGQLGELNPHQFRPMGGVFVWKNPADGKDYTVMIVYAASYYA